MTRRKKPPLQQHKRQQVTDSSGWTHIVKGPPSISDPQSTTTRLSQVRKSTSTKYTLTTYLDKFHNHYLPIWKSSTCFMSLSRIIEQEILPTEKNIRITQCVCLGLGSMTTGSESSSFELAALMSILDILKPILPSSSPITFQDPIFTPLDHEILQSLTPISNTDDTTTTTILPTPSAFSILNATAFLFAPHLECLHYATALETATPALCIGSDVSVYVDGLLSPVAENTRKGSSEIFRNFMEKVDSSPMPDFDHTPWCESTRIYWSRSEGNDTGEDSLEQGISSMNLAERWKAVQ